MISLSPAGLYTGQSFSLLYIMWFIEHIYHEKGLPWVTEVTIFHNKVLLYKNCSHIRWCPLNKIILKNKIFFLPTYPNFEMSIIGNTHTYIFWPKGLAWTPSHFSAHSHGPSRKRHLNSFAINDVQWRHHTNFTLKDVANLQSDFSNSSQLHW